MNEDTLSWTSLWSGYIIVAIVGIGKLFFKVKPNFTLGITGIILLIVGMVLLR